MKNKKNTLKLNRIIEDATTDCYEEYEQVAGWFCVLEENIKIPCKCFVGKHGAVLKEIDQLDKSILALVAIGDIKIRTPIEDIKLEDEETMKYIEAYKYWRKNEI